MDVSEDIRRELVYGLNGVVLGAHPDRPDAATFTRALFDVLRVEGPRHHEPDLVGAWAEAAGEDPEELELLVEDTVAAILEELEDDEEPWSAHRVLDLLAEESFWKLEWGLPGGTVATLPRRVAGLALPLELRPVLVAILDRMELALFEAHQAQRSVHDRLPQPVVDREIDRALDAMRRLGNPRKGVPKDLPEALVRTGPRLPDLRTALRVVQRWKLSVTFDASPDDDDGEWTMRVLERLYGLEWVLATEPGSAPR